MNNKLKYISLGVVIGVVLVLGTAATATDFRMGRTMEILVNMVRELTNSYVVPPDADELLRNAANGITAGLDPYTQFLDEGDFEQFESMIAGKYASIGSALRYKGDTLLFYEQDKDAPADRAGIRIGDALLKVDGKSMIGIEPYKIGEMLKGDVGSVVRITYKRLLDDSVKTVSVRREMIVSSSIVYSAMLNDSVGYIKHAGFTDNCSVDFKAAVEKLMASGAQKLIIDERDNGGGITQEAINILSLFVPRGTKVLEMKGRNNSENHNFFTNREAIAPNIELVILINEATASAAEILSGALQDLERATLIGQHSYGKGVVQSIRPVGYNTYLKLTTAHYYLPSGRTLEPGIGLSPDIETESTMMINTGTVYELFITGKIADFADMYLKKHPKLTIPNPSVFEITEREWNDFKAFVSPVEDDILESTHDEIIPLITSEIILRYCYAEGLYKYRISKDPEIQRILLSQHPQ